MPVVAQLLRTKHEHHAIAKLIILDNRQRGKGFTKTYAVGEDTAVEFFELVDDGKCGVPLEVVQLVPYL